MNTTTSNASIKEGLAANLRHLVDEADEFLKAAAHGGDKKFDAVRDQFADQLRQMRAQVDDLEDSAIRKARRAARTADRTLHNHPYSAIGIAAAAGLLIGLLAARR
jgi:ElaB/YqjD/DUF883 family membrane-anchored ribosome-binding protein